MSNLFDFWHQRGFVDNVTSEELKAKMKDPLCAYIGVDPTADSLHLGNLAGVVACAWLQRFGHTPMVLIGGGTAKIGDPSGKSVERPLLSIEELEKNAAAIRKQFERLLDHSSSKIQPQFVNNDQWLSSYSLLGFLRDVGKLFRLGPMLGKESVRSRLQSEEGISFTEFSYQVLQAYDFYHLFKEKKVVLQIGGSDQWGNITAGVELTRKLERKTIFGLTHPLITRSDGAKFGKSEEGAIWLDPDKTSPYQFYQYLVRISDADVGQLMRMLTFMDLEEITSFEEQLSKGDFVPHAAQKRLAEEITRFVHGEEKLQLALRVTAAIAPGSRSSLDSEVLREVAHAMPSVSLPIGAIVSRLYTELAVKAELVTSKSEAMRLIKNGGAYLNNRKVEDPAFAIKGEDLIDGEYLLFGAGKKKKVLIKATSS